MSPSPSALRFPFLHKEKRDGRHQGSQASHLEDERGRDEARLPVDHSGDAEMRSQPAADQRTGHHRQGHREENEIAGELAALVFGIEILGPGSRC